MKNWQITAKEQLTLVPATETLPENFARIRITRAGICDTDIALYTQDNTKYPITPCRHAVGVVSEINPDNEYGLEKGNNVAIEPYIPCNECYFCKTDDHQNCQNMKIFGGNIDGFLRDFATVPLENLKLLPENVRMEDAIFLEYIAIAIKVIDTIDLQKGEHVAIVGADILGNILAQLVTYYQAIPIIIDTLPQNLEVARSSNFYYTLNGDDNANKMVNEITGGRLAKYVVYISGSKKTFKNTLSYASEGATVAVTGLLDSNMMCNLHQVLQKQACIKGIKNGYGEFNSAINLLATKIVDLSKLVKKVYSFSNSSLAFEEHKEENLSSIFQIVIDCLEE